MLGHFAIRRQRVLVLRVGACLHNPTLRWRSNPVSIPQYRHVGTPDICAVIDDEDTGNETHAVDWRERQWRSAPIIKD